MTFVTIEILITEAMGFIASHPTELRVELGYDVRAFDRFNSNNRRGWLNHSDYKYTLEIPNSILELKWFFVHRILDKTSYNILVNADTSLIEPSVFQYIYDGE